MQHRKVYIDDWNLLEKICLASGVKRFGETWSVVCDFIKPRLQTEERPWDWFTPETCKAQYKQLYNECVKLQINSEDPVLQILHNLKSKSESGSLVEEHRKKYIALKNTLENITRNDISENELEEYYEKMLQSKKEKEEINKKFQESLKKRTVAKAEFEKSTVSDIPSNKQETTKSDGSSPLTTSPLLSSLLNNPPAVQYRPTLSTTSFIPSKSSQVISRTPSVEKIQIISADISSKDTCSPEVLDQSVIADRQSFNSSSAAVRKLDFQDPTCSSSMVQNQHSPGVKDVNYTKEIVSAPASELSANQALENLILMPTNDEVYLSEVDIPPETLLEVIDDLKGGAISLDKIIRDLEGTDDGLIINKEDLSSMTMKDSFATVETTKVEFVQQQPAHVEISLPEVKELSNEKLEPNLITVDESEEISETGIKNQVIDESLSVGQTVTEESSIEKVTVHDEAESSSYTPVTEEKVDCITQAVQNDLATVEQSNFLVEDTKVVLEPDITERDDFEHVEKELKENEHANTSELSGTDKSEVYHLTNSKNETDEIENLNDDTRISVDDYMTCESTSEQEQSENDISGEISLTITDITPTSEENVEVENEVVPESKIEKPNEMVIDLLNKQSEVENVSSNEIVPSEVVTVEKNLEETSQVEEKIVSENTDETQNSKTLIVEEMSEHEDEKEDVKVESAQMINDVQIEAVVEEPPSDVVEKLASANLYVVDKPEKQVDEKIESVADTKQIQSIDTKIEEQPLPAEIQEKVNEKSKAMLEEPIVSIQEDKTVIEPRKGHVQEILETENQEVYKNNLLTKSPLKRYGRKRKNTSTSETNETSAKVIKMLPEVNENVANEKAVRSIGSKELNITIKDIRDGGLESLEEKELLIPKVEPCNEIEQILDVTPVKVKVERENQTSETKQKPKTARRSSIRNRSPAKLTSRSRPSTSKAGEESELAKTRRKSILFAFQRLVSHKYSNAFQKPITNKQVPGYDNMVYSPMDLYTIKKKIDNKQITTVPEFQRDVLLMLNNAKMFNRVNSQVYNMAVEVQQESLPHIQLTVQTLGEGIRTMEKSNEKIRKRQSLEAAKKDIKPLKRMKSSTKEETSSAKKITSEENEDPDSHT